MEDKYLIPLSIIVAGAFVGGGAYFGLASPSTTATLGSGDTNSADTNPGAVPTAATGELAAVTDADHIRGSRDAEVFVVEFSDLECPFCAQFHPTMEQIVEEYDGRVAWVYRHFPLESIHPRARNGAEASECVAELAGNDAFWQFSDAIFADVSTLDSVGAVAQSVGVNRSQFDSCMASDRHEDAIDEDIADGTNAGAQGTPHSIVIAPNGKKFEVSGAQPIESVRATLDIALEEK